MKTNNSNYIDKEDNSQRYFNDGRYYIPNKFYELLLYRSDKLNKSDILIALTVLRKTLGFGKLWDQISISQFQKITGLCTASVKRSRTKLVASNIILTYSPLIGRGHIPFYAVNLGKGVPEDLLIVNENGRKRTPSLDLAYNKAIESGKGVLYDTLLEDDLWYESIKGEKGVQDEPLLVDNPWSESPKVEKGFISVYDKQGHFERKRTPQASWLAIRGKGVRDEPLSTLQKAGKAKGRKTNKDYDLGENLENIPVFVGKYEDSRPSYIAPDVWQEAMKRVEKKIEGGYKVVDKTKLAERIAIKDIIPMVKLARGEVEADITKKANTVATTKNQPLTKYEKDILQSYKEEVKGGVK